MKINSYTAIAATLLGSLAACGDDSSEAVDAAFSFIDAAVVETPDAEPTAPACDEFASPATTLSTYPASHNGNTGGAGANLQVASGVCIDERTFFTQAGDDQVIALTGLTAGTDYGIKIVSPADLSFYLATGCNEEVDGPASGQCLLFVDEVDGAGSEFGDFTAPTSGEVMIVVDTYYATPAADASYTLTVYEAACDDDDGCEGATPYCYERTCVACVSAFDCTESATPVCDATHTCAAGYDACVDDDAAENGDDGPAGATALSPEAGVPDVVEASICSSPGAEVDYYSFTVTEGESRAIQLDWAGTSADLDLVLVDADGDVLASSYYSQPEVVSGTEFEAGTYYVRVYQYEPASATAVTDYTLTAVVPECQTSFDCAEVSAPVCSPAGLCIAGSDQCTGDDDSENGDDGPAGASAISVTYDVTSQVIGHICSDPKSEADFYTVEVAAGDNLTISLGWTATTPDLDLFVYTADGASLGFTYWMKPDVVTLTNLPAGTVYLMVSYYGTAVTAATEYTLDLLATAGGCSAPADCASEYATQRYRGNCDESGACLFVDGAGLLADGQPCDSYDDCDSGMCSYILFESDAATSVCTVGCSSDADCTTALGAGYKCTAAFIDNFCHPDCTDNTDCGANTNSSDLDTDQPWNYLTCTAGTCDL